MTGFGVDPAQLDAVAARLDADEDHRTRRDSEGAWSGGAGDAFRTRLGTAVGPAGALGRTPGAPLARWSGGRVIRTPPELPWGSPEPRRRRGARRHRGSDRGAGTGGPGHDPRGDGLARGLAPASVAVGVNNPIGGAALGAVGLGIGIGMAADRLYDEWVPRTSATASTTASWRPASGRGTRGRGTRGTRCSGDAHGRVPRPVGQERRVHTRYWVTVLSSVGFVVVMLLIFGSALPGPVPAAALF